MFEQPIADQNPHWGGTMLPEGIRRDALAEVEKRLALPHVLSLVGVRRSGKSTLARQAINHLVRDRDVPSRNILFLNLETPQFTRHRNDVAALDRIYDDYLKVAEPVPGKPVYCFLDEVHFFPEWQVFVKSRYERKGIKFVVTGSNSRLLSSEFVTLLSGRTLPIEVRPFSFREFARARDIRTDSALDVINSRLRLRRAFDEHLRFGGFPETAFIDDPSRKREVVAMYARNILYQDIAPRFGIKKAQDLEDLFFHLVSNIGSRITWNRLAALTNLSDKTVKEYISYFADACLLFTVEAYTRSTGVRLRSPRKVFAIDTGLAATASFSVSDDFGHFLENLVFLELTRQGRDVFHYTTAGNLEVDFLVMDGKKPGRLIQSAWTISAARTRDREIRALSAAMEEMKLPEGTIVTRDEEDEVRVDGRTIRIVPAWKFLLEK